MHATSIRTVTTARTFLFVPGNRPERFDKALLSGADAVILDLEDAVPPSAKDEARMAVQRSLPQLAKLGVPLVVRINTSDSPAGQADLRALKGLQGLAAVMVPKAESVAALTAVSYALPNVAIIPLIESAKGFIQLQGLAEVPSVVRLAVGHIDFLADTGIQCSEDERELDPLRFTVAMVSRNNDLSSAIDGVTVDLDAHVRLTRDTYRTLRFGFGAKLCIHPKQVESIHAAMRPSHAQVDWAKRVISADEESGGAAVRVDGRMVDAPVVLQAKRLLALLGTES